MGDMQLEGVDMQQTVLFFLFRVTFYKSNSLALCSNFFLPCRYSCAFVITTLIMSFQLPIFFCFYILMGLLTFITCAIVSQHISTCSPPSPDVFAT